MRTAEPRARSTAAARRPIVVQRAVECFAAGGWSGTTIADVAEAAEISNAYVVKMFPSKELLFIAALDECFDRIEAVLHRVADENPGSSADELLYRMGGAYAHLIADKAVLMMQVHAQSAATNSAIAEALRAGLARVTHTAWDRSGSTPEAVQRFMAFGQLCHLIVTVGIDRIDADWARLLAAGIRHPDF